MGAAPDVVLTKSGTSLDISLSVVACLLRNEEQLVLIRCGILHRPAKAAHQSRCFYIIQSMTKVCVEVEGVRVSIVVGTVTDG